MQHSATKPNIMVAEVILPFEAVYKKPYFAFEYQDEIRKANLLLIPSENIREGLEPVFPEMTFEFLTYLRENAGKDTVVDIAVSDDKFYKMVLHTSMVPLPTMLVRPSVLKDTACLVDGFLKELASQYHREENELDTVINIIVDDGRTCQKIMYRGRIQDVKEQLDQAIHTLTQGE